MAICGGHIHIDALIMGSNKGMIGESYCIGSGYEISNLYMLNKICQCSDETYPTKFNYKELISNVKDRPGHDFRYSLDSSKIKNQLGLNAKNDIEKGLRLTIYWYIQKQDFLI